MPTREELRSKFGKVDDPEIEAPRQQILEVLLEATPQTQQKLWREGWRDGFREGFREGRLTHAREILRRVLTRRQLLLTTADDARIEACTDLATLERWLDQAVTAVSASDALG